MFKQIKDGTSETIQGLQCWIPPQPPKSEIQGSHLAKKRQKWRRTELPKIKAKDIEWFSRDLDLYDPNEELDWEIVRREEIIAQTGCDPWNVTRQGEPKPYPGVEADPDYTNPILEAFRQQELKRIKNGHWFMNNGKAVYITGHYYFYLNWWKLNTGYPEFRDTDRRLFYFWQYCLEDRRCFGIIEITKRGVGKSYRAGALAYLMTISYRKSHVGLQSKSDPDVEELYSQKIVEPMKDLPDFLVPVNSHGTDPQGGLRFFAPAKRGKNAAISAREKRKEIRSMLTFRSCKNKAYDGTTLRFLVQDEIGKLDPKFADAYKRLLVNKQCVYRDSKMVGKIWCTTTVEEMELGGEQCKKIWYDSDVASRNAAGRTKSGLYRYFTSTLDASYFDEYGYPDQERARAEHDAERESLGQDPVLLTSYIQKNPYTIDEAFMTTGDNCLYNAMILQERQVFLQNPKADVVQQGDFVWKIKDKVAEWVPNDVNGKWFVSWIFSDDERFANRVRVTGEIDGVKQLRPLNIGKFGFAVDPYSHKQTVEKRRSKLAGAIFKNADFFTEDIFNETFCADYVYRHPNPEDAYEDMLIAAHYFGVPILVENNKGAMLNYMRRRGYAEFIQLRPEATADTPNQITDGIPSNTKTIEYYINETIVHVHTNGHKLKHLRIVRDLLDFDPQAPTKFDLGVAAQLAIVAAQVPVTEQLDETDISTIFTTWDNSGSQSEMLEYQ